MKIQILGSSSKGNAYLVEMGGTRLLLECGMPWKKLQQLSGFTMSDVDACLISHEHGDHGCGAADAVRNGVPVYTSAGTAQALGIDGHYRCRTIVPYAVVPVGATDVMALPVEHDAAEPFAYLIRDDDEVLLFATDTPYLPYNVPGLTHAMVEANYDDELMDAAQGELNRRIRRSHMSIGAIERWLREGDAAKTLQQIYLLHLSDERSDAAAFKERIQRATGAEVYIA